MLIDRWRRMPLLLSEFIKLIITTFQVQGAARHSTFPHDTRVCSPMRNWTAIVGKAQRT